MAASRAMDENKNWIRTFQVTQPVRHKKGFTVYKITSKMFHRSYPESATTISVWKRYTDFKKLYTELHLIHSQLHLQGEFPKFPKAKVFGRFDYEVVEERRKAALAFLEFASKHSLLFTSKVFVRFFETGYSTRELVDIAITEEDNQELRQPDYESCLVPERLWDPGSDVDTISASSVESTSHETGPNTTDTDSLMSRSAFSGSGEVLECNGRDSTERVISIPGASNHARTQSLTSFISTDSSIQNGHPEQLKNSSFVNIPSINASDIDISFTPIPIETSATPRPISVSQSCSSLASLEIPVFPRPIDKSESSIDLQNTGNMSSFKKTLSVSKKKLNGLGFFDFLPNFSKRQNGKVGKVSEEELLTDSLSASYICEAAGHFNVAQRHESNREFSRAFRAYKEGIRILLVGAKDDEDLKRKRLVKSKLDRYLNRAEKLFENHLTLSPSTSRKMGGIDPTETSISPVSFNAEKVWQNALNPDFQERNKSAYLNMEPSPISELKEYKLARIIQRQVYFVVNIKDCSRPKCYAIKILQKSPAPIFPDKPTIIPNNIPFMVKLFHWFEAENSYVLVMEYAGGGVLKDFVELYQTKPATFYEPYSPEPNSTEENASSDANGAIDHQELTKDMLSVLDALADLGSDKENCESYNRLFEEYSESVQDGRTPLATLKNEPELVEFLKKPKRETHEEVGSMSENEHGKNFTVYVDSKSHLAPTSIDKLIRDFGEGKNADTVGIENLIESSKLLLRNVNQTLAAVRTTPDDIPSTSSSLPFSNTKSSEANLPTMLLKTEKPGDTLYKETENNQSSTEILNFIGGGDNDPGSSKDLLVINPKEEEEDKTEHDDANGDEPLTTPQRIVPECCVKIWAAEIVLALEKLHGCGLAFGDLDMKNILLGENGHILLSYTSQWSDVDQTPELPITKNECSAPEILSSLGLSKWKIHPSSDFWSLGVILFDLIAGQTLRSAHPEGFHHPDSALRIPEKNCMGDLISHHGRTLLSELLQYTPSLRLGYYGAAEVKSHPFFEGFDWEGALEAGCSVDEEERKSC